MRRILVILVVVFSACTGNNSTGETNNLNSLDSNTANNSSVPDTKELLIQSFTQVPSIINNCSALFVTDSNNTTENYVFVTDLKGTAFIKLNNRLMELKLVKQTNVDKYTVNELYVNDEVEVDLKIKQLKEQAFDGEWNYNGVLVVRRGAMRAVTSISGKLGC